MKIYSSINQSTMLMESVNTKGIEKEELPETFSFKNAINDAQIITNQGIVQELIQKFERQEKIVIKNPTVGNIGEYKKIIKALLNIASNNYKCEDVNVYSCNGFQKNLSLSKIIDEKLDEVVKDFISTNKLSLESISNMEDIKGLILNIFV